MSTLERATFIELLEHWAAQTPGSPYVQCGGDWLTFADVSRHSACVAGGLQQLGLQRGDRVAFLLQNREEFVLAYFACSRLGAVMVPLNAFLRGEFLRYQLADSQACVLVTDELGVGQVRELEIPDVRDIVVIGPVAASAGDGLAQRLVPFADLESATAPTTFAPVPREALSSIIYTSGTTGFPKGCLVSYRYARQIAQTMLDAGLFAEGDRLLTAWPMFHPGGHVYGLGVPLLVGGSVVLEPEFHASTTMSRAAETGATVLYGMGAMAIAMMAQPTRPTDTEHQLRVGFYMPLKPEVQEAFEHRFHFHVLSECFGQTECVPVTLSRVDGPRNRASAGSPLPQFEVRIADPDDEQVPIGEVGEILVRPRRPGVMFEGYWRKPEETLQAFRNLWHHTGDYGRVDDDGFLYFVDRKKDALRRRGEFVSSLTLEQALLQHPDVQVAAVHAVPSEMTEDDIKAWLVPQPGCTLEIGELFDYFRKVLPYYAIPRYVDVVDALPVNAAMRVMKHQLKALPNTASTYDLEALGLIVDRAERRT